MLQLCERFEVFPKFGVLLGQLRFRNRKFVAQKKILQRVLVQDVEHVKRLLLPHFKVETKVTTPQAVKFLSGPGHFPQRFTRVLQVGRAQIAQRINGRELGEFIELIQLEHGLVGESDLEHRGEKFEQGQCNPATQLPSLSE